MKKLITLLLAGFYLATGLKAQNSTTLIQGIYNKDNVQAVVLLDVQDGEKVGYAATQLTKGKQFAFALPALEKGFYYLSDQNKNAFIRIYLKPGDKIRLQVEEESYQFIQPTPENQILKSWVDFSYPVTRISIQPKDSTTYRSFFPTLTAFLPKAAAFKRNIKTPNKAFNQLFQKSIEAELEHAALRFILMPRLVKPSKEEYPAYYHTLIQEHKYADPDFLQFGFATELISLYTAYTSIITGKTGPGFRRSVREVTDLFGNDRVKGIYAASQLVRFRTLEEFNKEIDPVKQYLVTDSMQAQYWRVLKRLSPYKQGNAAYEFSFPDPAGKAVSMADLKGKVVLIDLWATWCVPCIAEIPHLKKLEEELKDKNIQFVSISIDVEKDKDKWLKFLEKQQLGGIQLFANGWGDMTRYYDINTVPRFMVFDAEGKIVTIDAPRPSDPQLKELLLRVADGKGLTLTPARMSGE
jgi:thiol-disulfide isomerase/thioredoxin